jgi:hypothetical protein
VTSRVRRAMVALLLCASSGFAEPVETETGQSSGASGGIFALFGRRKPATAEAPAASEPAPSALPPGEASPSASATDPAEPPSSAIDAPAQASAPPPAAPPAKQEIARRTEENGATARVQAPPVEIQGEIEKPDIFFVLPRARDQSDEQLMRARIRREIARPVIKDWVEEEMLIK